jgi:hypothetical protein
LTAADLGDHHPGRAVAYYGRVAMAKNIALGFTISGLILMVLLAFAQEHHECLQGHLIVREHLMRGHLIKAFKGFRACGSVSPSM